VDDHLFGDCLENVGPLTSHNHTGLHGLLQEYLRSPLREQVLCIILKFTVALGSRSVYQKSMKKN
jgi:hypothetical protein